MQDLNDKITGGTLEATEWNEVPSEIQNVIESQGIVLSSGDLNQLGKSLAGYISNGHFFSDSGAVNTYVLSVVGSRQNPPSLVDGFEVSFLTANPNTAAATVNASGLGVKSIKLRGGDDPVANDISGRVELSYDLANDWFELTNPSVTNQSITKATIAAAKADDSLVIGSFVRVARETSQDLDYFYEVVAADTGTADGVKFIDSDTSSLFQLLRVNAETQTISTLSAMINSSFIAAGDFVRTLGALTVGDGGENDYEIFAAGTGQTDNYINLDSGLQAKALLSKPVNLAAQNKGYLLAELDVSSAGFPSERFAQGFMFNSRANKLYLYQRTLGSTDKLDERQSIVEFDLGAEGATLVPVSSTADLTSGHQGMGIEYRSAADPTSIYLWTKAAPHLADTASNEQTGKHVFRWDYKGGATTNVDAVRYEIFPDYGSALPLEAFYNLTPTISTCGTYLLGKVSSFGGGSDQRIFIWDLAVINSYTVGQIADPANFNRDSDAYITDWALSRVQLRTGNFTQAISCDGSFVHVTCGSSSLLSIGKDNNTYTMSGVLVDRYNHTMGSPDTISPQPGTPVLWEPEGGCIRTNGNQELLTLVETSYDDGGTNRVIHQVWGLRASVGTSINQNESQFVELGSDIHFDGGVPREVTFNPGETIEIGTVDKVTGDYVKLIVIQADGSLELHQPDDPSAGSRVTRGPGVGREILELRGNTGISSGASINLYGASDTVNPSEILMYTQGNSGSSDLKIDAAGLVHLSLPTSDPAITGALWNNSGVVTVS